MKKLLVSCLLLIGCGSSTTTSTGAPIAGDYHVTARASGGSCSSNVCVDFTETWTIAGANGGWLLTAGTVSGTGSVAGDTLTGDATTGVQGTQCNGTATFHYVVTITAAGFGGNLDRRIQGPDCSPPVDCNCTYALTATR